ncbi:MAG: hypothetical protein HY925_05025 [Elusimicrobia bacterium]|nr:hypothetical protein [Elusimicrobiota bacterium]
MSFWACWSCRNVLDLHVDGRLTAKATENVARHLVDCAECRAEADALRPVPMSMKDSDIEVPPGLAEAIFKKWEDGAEPERLAAPAFRFAPAQAAALVYLAVLAGGSATSGDVSRGLPGKPGIEAPWPEGPGESFRTAP